MTLQRIREHYEASMTQAMDERAIAAQPTEPVQPSQRVDLPRQTAAETPAAGSAPVGRRPRLLVLDGLRLGAALMVVAYHLVGDKIGVWEPSAATTFGPLHSIAKYGFLGVQLFFVISGFVICMSAWGRSVGDFFVSRVVRLYPAYWFAVLAAAAVLVAVPRGVDLKVREVVGNLTMMQEFLGIRHLDLSYWTLTVEMIFYILFAVLVARGLTYRGVVAFCAIWTIASLIVPKFGNAGLTNVVAAGYSSYFIAGIALYLIYRFGPNLLLWSIVGLSWLIAITRLPALAEARDVSLVPTVVIVTAFVLVMAAVALNLFSWVKWPWVATAGAMTYPLYLIHQTVGLAVIDRLQDHVSPWLLVTALIAALLIAAWLIHRFVERPAARWMKRQLNDSMRQLRTTR
ncbi:acyltransferase [Micromonospora sp. 4G57]|uniref:Acyltransferase n=1 Tax=Micromonospora sicca TaxID=2202420 RepID=A0ABU5JCQ6_9ACTN|nr:MULTISPECIES: acyltransferase [unclassified Micromonospora]MDZ5444484.1 acyltransferase [Micromonospora sp. 4G57]MDZ5490368.1 acyltransferase [Micromonospora sp. 4G53]